MKISWNFNSNSNIDLCDNVRGSLSPWGFSLYGPSFARRTKYYVCDSLVEFHSMQLNGTQQVETLWVLKKKKKSRETYVLSQNISSSHTYLWEIKILQLNGKDRLFTDNKLRTSEFMKRALQGQIWDDFRISLLGLETCMLLKIYSLSWTISWTNVELTEELSVQMPGAKWLESIILWS